MAGGGGGGYSRDLKSFSEINGLVLQQLTLVEEIDFKHQRGGGGGGGRIYLVSGGDGWKC